MHTTGWMGDGDNEKKQTVATSTRTQGGFSFRAFAGQLFRFLSRVE